MQACLYIPTVVADWSSLGPMGRLWLGHPFITAVVTFLLLGVENIGIQIEEPFEVLPIEAISNACITGVQEIMQRHAGRFG